jgi:carboxylesterase
MATRQSPLESSQPFYYPGGPVGVLLVHGFTGTPFIFRELGKELADQGYTVSAPLLAGHGTHPDDLEKTTWKDWYKSIEAAYDKLAEDCQSVYVVGASFGGNLCCYLATKRKINGLILIGMPRWIYKHRLATMAATFMQLVGIRYYNKPLGKITDGDSLLGGPNYSYLKIPVKSAVQFFDVVDDMTEPVLAKIKIPTLLIQSDNDGLVKPISGKAIFEKIASDHKQLIWINAPHHELHQGKNRKLIYSYITDFMVRLNQPD